MARWNFIKSLSWLLFAFLVGCSWLSQEPTLSDMWDSVANEQNLSEDDITYFFALGMAEHHPLVFEIAAEDIHTRVNEWFLVSDSVETRNHNILSGNTTYYVSLGPCTFEIDDIDVQTDELGQSKVTGWKRLAWIGTSDLCPNEIEY